ncbi:MAG: helix-turn-helix domain-containing protein [Lachnospiraceae bacterium]
MAVKPCPLTIDIDLHEKEIRGTPMFPCGSYKTTVGDNHTKLIPWHWHEEVEIMFITKGTLKVEVPNNTIIIKEGEGAFINSSVLQTAVNLNNDICQLDSFVFDPSLIFGSLENAIEQKYVRPLITAPELSLIRFGTETAWHREVLQHMKAAFQVYSEEMFGYELLVRDHLSKLWFLIVTNHQNQLSMQQNTRNAEAVRTKEMLAYIHTNYAENLDLKEISQSAAISTRECLRCFNKVLGTTPMKYLLNHRISVASGLLINTDLNITEICKLSGFESPSYFSLKFKTLTEKTPSEYRQQHKN